MDQLTVKPYQFDRDAEVISLLNRVFNPWMGDQAYFTWKYRSLELPDCNFPRAWIIEKDGKIVAFNGYVPRKLRLNDGTVWVAQSFDTVTDPECRGGGLFGTLQNAVYNEMTRHHIVWVYGWTSEIGFKVFRKKVNWRIWGEQRFLMKVLDTGWFAAQKVKNPALRLALYAGMGLNSLFRKPAVSRNISIQQEPTFPSIVNDLLDRVCKEFDMIAMRNVDYLQWRFSNPLGHYQLLSARRNGAQAGYLVLSDREDCIDIDDVIADSPETLSSLLAAAEDIGRNAQKKMVRFRINVDHQWTDTFKRAGYFWSKTSWPMLGRPLAPDLGAAMNASNLHWTLFDRNE